MFISCNKNLTYKRVINQKFLVYFISLYYCIFINI
nr:MAG TPA: hypothetical protein [Caudoviricetes sp.]